MQNEARETSPDREEQRSRDSTEGTSGPALALACYIHSLDPNPDAGAALAAR